MTAMNAKRRICTALLVLLTLPAAQGQIAAVPDTAATAPAVRRGGRGGVRRSAPDQLSPDVVPPHWRQCLGRGNHGGFRGDRPDGHFRGAAFPRPVRAAPPRVDPWGPALSPGWTRWCVMRLRKLGGGFALHVMNCSLGDLGRSVDRNRSNAMRHLAWSRTDLSAEPGRLPRPVSDGEAWRDYRDIACWFPDAARRHGRAAPPVAGERGRPALARSGRGRNRELPRDFRPARRATPCGSRSRSPRRSWSAPSSCRA